MTPTGRTLTALRADGWTADKVERREGPRSHDLFGLWDVLAIDSDGQVLAVQATSSSNVSARIRKIESDELADALAECRKAGWQLENRDAVRAERDAARADAKRYPAFFAEFLERATFDPNRRVYRTEATEAIVDAVRQAFVAEQDR